MTKPVSTVTPDTPAEDAWTLMQQRRLHHLVVTHGREMVGVVSAGDLGGPAGEGTRRNRAVDDFMTTGVVSATPRTTVREAANLMRGRAIECLPVLDGSELVGIITTTELLELLGKGTERPLKPSRRHILKERGQGLRQKQPRARR